MPEKEEMTSKTQLNGHVGQEQIHDLLFSEKLSWQAIIYDLINTEQLDPWDIDLGILAEKFLIKVRELEEANFFVSSKVLFAAALLLRIKSEILLHKYLPSLDDILFGREKEKISVQERLELDEEIPGLMPRTPLPRLRKVSLQELMASLGKAINTEQRRIKRIVIERQREIEAGITLPKRRINVHDKMEEIYKLIKKLFSEKNSKMAFSNIAGKSKEEKIEAFMPLLHLDTQHKVVLEQENQFDEIWVWMKSHYDGVNAEELERMQREVEREIEEIAVEKIIEEGLSEESGEENGEIEDDVDEGDGILDELKGRDDEVNGE